MAKFRASFIPLVIVMLMLVGAACGSDDGDTNAGNTAQEEQEEPEEETEEESTPEETGPPTIVATEFAFELPETLPAGETTFQFENAGEQRHIAVWVELLEGKTLTDVNNFIAESGVSGRPPSWVRPVRAEGFAKPGETTEFKGEFTPGTYAVLCFIRDKETKKTHAELGMTAEVTFE